MTKLMKMSLVSALMATGAMASVNSNYFGNTVLRGDDITISEEHSLTLQKDPSIEDVKGELITNYVTIKGTGTLKSDGKAVLCNLYPLIEVEDSDNAIKTAAQALLGADQQIDEVYTIGTRGRVDSSVTIDNGVTVRDYSLMSTLNHPKYVDNLGSIDEAYGTNRLFNLTVTEGTDDTYENAIGIGGTWSGEPAETFKAKGASIATIPTDGCQAAGIGIESSSFDLNVIRACTGSVFVNTSTENIELTTDKDCALPGKFVTRTESTEDAKPTITLNGSGNTLTFNESFDASATGINLKAGVFVFNKGITI